MRWLFIHDLDLRSLARFQRDVVKLDPVIRSTLQVQVGVFDGVGAEDPRLAVGVASAVRWPIPDRLNLTFRPQRDEPGFATLLAVRNGR